MSKTITHGGAGTPIVVAFPSQQISTAIPESPLYNQLLEMDRVVTDMINRRKADFKEPFPPYHEPVKRVLRVAVQVRMIQGLSATAPCVTRRLLLQWIHPHLDAAASRRARPP